MNIPILTASNIIQFGKLYANGFKTARRAINIVGKAGEYTAGTTRLGATTAITKVHYLKVLRKYHKMLQVE